MPAYGPLAPLYDRLTRDVDYEAFADFYEAVFREREAKVRSLLDLGCGTGSLTAIMASRGFDLVAADASPEMLAVARDKCGELSGVPSPLFICQSMTELDLYGAVDAAYSSLDAFNYLPPEDMPEVFRLLHLFIEPGGLFIFDINTPQRLRSLDGFISVDEDEDILCLWRADFDPEEKALFYGMDIFTRRGRFWQRSFEEHVEYAHEPEKLVSLLEEAGFENIELRNDGPQNDLGRLFVVAENSYREE